MKKVMFLVMVAVMPFISCSSDDDNGVAQDIVIGKWQLVSKSKFVGDEQQQTPPVSDCEKRSWVEFHANGRGTSLYYDTDGVGECVTDAQANEFLWTSKGNQKYEIGVAGDEGTEEYVIKVEGSTLSLIESSVYEGVTTTSTENFNRVQ